MGAQCWVTWGKIEVVVRGERGEFFYEFFFRKVRRKPANDDFCLMQLLFYSLGHFGLASIFRRGHGFLEEWSENIKLRPAKKNIKVIIADLLTKKTKIVVC